MVAFDAVGPAGGAGFYQVGGTYSWAHINSAAGNALIVGITDASGTTNLVTAVTYGGVALSFLGYGLSGGAAGGISFYGRIGGLPTGSNTVSVTSSSATVACGSVSLTSPGSFGTPGTPTSGASGAVMTGPAMAGTTSGGLVVAIGAIGSTGVFTATSPNIIRVACQGDSVGTSNSLYLGTDPSTGGTVTPVFASSGTADNWVVVAVEVLPASAALTEYPRQFPPGRFAPLASKFPGVPFALPVSAPAPAFTQDASVTPAVLACSVSLPAGVVTATASPALTPWPAGIQAMIRSSYY